MPTFKHINNNFNQMIAFQSTLPQDFEKQVSDDYQKDLVNIVIFNK
jgi:hypothetical protein